MKAPTRSGSWPSVILVQLLCLATGFGAEGAPGEINYNRDIRPLLSENCFFCHGPDEGKRKGKFRLDERESAVTKKAIVPGRLDQSELIQRIHSKDAEELMPPPKSNKHLDNAQKELLARWIKQGAPYEKHWAFVLPRKPAAPADRAIDFLVQKRLRSIGLEPSPEAARWILARRLSLDLIGLPPTPEEVEAFERDSSPDAYGKMVDRLLASPHFGERMAIDWLDVVRFADTTGYHSDAGRNVWPYRDYVIKAFNENKRFDVFTREQLAGDLLPNCTSQQKVASAYNRLIRTTEEQGAQPKDYELRMMADQVRAVGAVWLGQTIGCAQCHDHKFDPITSRDFYALGAFFADIDEPATGAREPGMALPTAEQSAELAHLQDEIARLKKTFEGSNPQIDDLFRQWIADARKAIELDRQWTRLAPSASRSAQDVPLKIRPDHSILAEGAPADRDTYQVSFRNGPPSILGLRVEALTDESMPLRGPGRGIDGQMILTEIVVQIQRAGGRTEVIPLSSAWADFEQTINVNLNPYGAWSAASVIDGDVLGDSHGWALLPTQSLPHQLVVEFIRPVKLQRGDTLSVELQQNHGRNSLGRFRISAGTSLKVLRGPIGVSMADDLIEILERPERAWSPEQKHTLLAAFKQKTPEMQGLRDQIAAAQKAVDSLEASIPRCLVTNVVDPRPVRILPQGNFLVDSGKVVEPGFPAYLSGKTRESRRLNRLDLANWLVSRENPLTARVVMNRLWKQFFGVGLSKVSDDFGAQGEPPANQELLDWLACEFMDSGWNVQHMVRTMVTSSTYRQTSVPSRKARERDPLNRELASQSRWRLKAEIVRDNALTISGLLVQKMGGPSVKPYQPEDYWEHLSFPERQWQQSRDGDQYRRGVYTWWQRTFLHPDLTVFDAPSREECATGRIRSNVPQQALVLLNSTAYVEASRAFAACILREGGSNTATRLGWAWRKALARPPRADELETAQALLEKHLAGYRQDGAAAAELLKIGDAGLPPELDPAELAAWTSVARVILNLHETITRS